MPSLPSTRAAEVAGGAGAACLFHICAAHTKYVRLLEIRILGYLEVFLLAEAMEILRRCSVWMIFACLVAMAWVHVGSSSTPRHIHVYIRAILQV